MSLTATLSSDTFARVKYRLLVTTGSIYINYSSNYYYCYYLDNILHLKV